MGLKSRLSGAAGALLAGISGAVSRFPVATLAILGMTIVANLLVGESDTIEEDSLDRLLLSLGVAAALAVASVLLMEANGGGRERRVVASAVVAAGAGLLVWFGINRFLFVPPVVAAAVLAIPLAPHLRRSTSARFWMFATWTGFGCSLSFVSVLLFVVGVSAILEMVRYLFDLGLSGRSYEHVFTTAITLVGPLFALGRIPLDFTEEPQAGTVHSRLTSGWQVLQNWVAVPLVLAASVVLHFYAAKILVTGEVPKNQIGWIVATYALLLLSQRVAADPFLVNGGAALRLFGRLWVAMLVVPLALLSYAVWTRIAAEGVTSERYYLALAAISAAVVVAMQAVPKLRGDIRAMTAVPTVLLALSSLGPLGVAAIVAKSQSALILRDFAPDGVIDANALSPDRQTVLRSRITAVDEVGAVDTVLPLLSAADRQAVEGAASDASTRMADRIFARLQLDYGSSLIGTVSFDAREQAPFDVGGFDRVYIYAQGAQAVTDRAAEAGPGPLVLSIRGKQLSIRHGGRIDGADLSVVVRDLASRAGDTNPDKVAPPAFDLRLSGGGTIRLRVHRLVYDTRTLDPQEILADIALREAEWRR